MAMANHGDTSTLRTLLARPALTAVSTTHDTTNEGFWRGEYDVSTGATLPSSGIQSSAPMNFTLN